MSIVYYSADPEEIVTERAEDERARSLVHDKYAPAYGGDLQQLAHDGASGRR